MSDPIQRWDDNTAQALRYIGIVERNGWEGENLLPSCITLRTALQSAAAHEAKAVAAAESEWVRDAHQMCAAAYKRGQRDVFAFHPEWTVTGMCKPDCLPCQRLTELINERSAGYKEGQQDERARIRAGVNASDWAGLRGYEVQEAVLAVIDAEKGET